MIYVENDGSLALSFFAMMLFLSALVLILELGLLPRKSYNDNIHKVWAVYKEGYITESMCGTVSNSVCVLNSVVPSCDYFQRTRTSGICYTDKCCLSYDRQGCNTYGKLQCNFVWGVCYTAYGNFILNSDVNNTIPVQLGTCYDSKDTCVGLESYYQSNRIVL